MRGIKRPSSLTIKRRLVLLRRLVQGTAFGSDLIASVRASPEAVTYPESAQEALRYDLKMIRRDWGCVIHYTPSSGYMLDDLGQLALLNMGDELLQAFAFLEATYATDGQPMHRQVSVLLQVLRLAIPPTARDRLGQGGLRLRLVGPRAQIQIQQSTIDCIRQAIGHRFLRFSYRPSYRPGHEEHQVVPLELFVRDSHIYLLAYCPTVPRTMEECYGGYVEFRVDHMLPHSVRRDPRHVPPVLPARPCWRVVYWLSPIVARSETVAAWLPETHIVYAADHSATVTAMTPSLWQARQVILRYGEHACAIAPPELVTMMRDTIKQMTAHYVDKGTFVL